MHDEWGMILDLDIDRLVRDDTTILQDVHLRIARGVHWAVLGANGSGKSTLLSVIAGYEWPTRGRVALLGEEYGRTYMPALKRRVGLVSDHLSGRFVSKEPALDVATSGLYATIGPWVRYEEDDYEAGRRALAAIGASHLAARAYGHLSHGERQRVMIARALVRQPDVLILDEPCTGLDPVAREGFLSDVDALLARDQGPTAIVVTHHLDELPSKVTHALVLREGSPVACGPIIESVTDETMSAAFGAPCRVHRESDRLRLDVVR